MMSNPPSLIYQALNQARKEIRLATVAPNEDRDAPMVVELHTVPLRSSPSYHALSYCWTGLSGTEDIDLCGQKTSVTKNLAEALRQFRSEKLTSRWWIDALCINQKDIRECNVQVALMRELYNRASNVHVWLGPSESQTEVGFSFLRYTLSGPELDVGSDQITGEFTTSEEFQALGTLFRNPYWQRRWITQEILLACSLYIRCGDFKIGPLINEVFLPITTYTDTCLDIACRNLGARDSFFNIVLDETSAVLTALIPFIDPSRTRNASQLNGFFRTSTSVAHDYVYGLLGILPKGLGIIPDYELDVSAVFTDFAFRFMKSYNVIHLLYLADHATDDLPSWVPDFRKQRHTMNTASTIWDRFDSGSSEEAFRNVYLLSNLAHVYDASLGAPFGILHRIENVLVVSGVVIDKIVAIGGRGREPKGGFQDLNDTVALLRSWQQLYYQQLEERKIVNQSCYEKNWFEIAIDFTFTACADVRRNFDDPRRQFHRCSRAQFEEYLLGLFWSPSEWPEGVDAQQMKTRFQWLDLLAARNTFFITAQGRMGFATGETRIGDDICILSGSNLPIHLREIGQNTPPRYIYQGVAYVQGVMYGEAVLEVAGEDKDRIHEVFGEIYIE